MNLKFIKLKEARNKKMAYEEINPDMWIPEKDGDNNEVVLISI